MQMDMYTSPVRSCSLALDRSKSKSDQIRDMKVYGPNESTCRYISTYLLTAGACSESRACSSSVFFTSLLCFRPLDLLLWPPAFHLLTPLECVSTPQCFASVSVLCFIFFRFVCSFLSVMDYVKVFFILNVLIKSC